MKTVSISELKARLSAFLDIVREGDEVLVTDRGRLVAASSRWRAGTPTPGDESCCSGAGGSARPWPAAGRFPEAPSPADTKGRSLAALLEERDTGR